MELLEAVEGLQAVRLLKSSFYAYPVVNALHIAAIGFLLSSVVLLDLRLLGAFRSLPAGPFVSLLRRVALAAFAGAVLTGAALFSVRAVEYSGMPVFLAKMALIVAAGMNLLIFLIIDKNSGEAAGQVLRLSAIVSIALWCGVLLCGRFIGFL